MDWGLMVGYLNRAGEVVVFPPSHNILAEGVRQATSSPTTLTHSGLIILRKPTASQLGLRVRGTTIAYSSIGTASIANGVLVNFLPLYVFGFTGSDFLAASISSVPAISAMVMSPFWGALNDRTRSVKPLMPIGVLPYAGLCFFLLIVNDVPGIFVGWSVASLLISSTTPVFAAYVTASERKRGASIGLLAASMGSGGALGAIVGGITYQWYDLRLAFLFGGVGAILAGFMIFLLLREGQGVQGPIEVKTRIATLRVLQNPGVLKPCISCFSYMVGITAFSALASIYVVEILGGSRLLWGVSTTLAYVFGALAIAPLGRLSDRVGRKPIIGAGLFLQVALLLSFLFFRDPLFVAILLVAPLAYVVCNTITTLVTDFSGERERGKAVGIQYSFLNGGGVVGPMLGGAIAEVSGIGMVLVFAIACVLFSLLWLQRMVSDSPALRESIATAI
jgi:MFS family permease